MSLSQRTARFSLFSAPFSFTSDSLTNAHRLLPTNCLRACTASPTEISFNHSNDLAEAYRAEIEFITTEDWTKELDALFRDMLDAGGEISRECTNADSDSGVAYAKVKAVYPNKTKEMIAKSNSKDLVNEPRVRGVLGTVKKLRESSAEALYRGLQYFVDSKEKNKEKEKEMEYWPLIKVVRIFTKAKALSTGVIMVDLVCHHSISLSSSVSVYSALLISYPTFPALIVPRHLTS